MNARASEFARDRREARLREQAIGIWLDMRERVPGPQSEFVLRFMWYVALATVGLTA